MQTLPSPCHHSGDDQFSSVNALSTVWSKSYVYKMNDINNQSTLQKWKWLATHVPTNPKVFLFFYFFIFLQLLNKVTLVVTPKAESLPRHSSQLHSFTKLKPQLKNKEKSALFCNFNLVSQFVDASMFNSFISPPTAPHTLHTETTLWLPITDRHITLLSFHWF